MGNNSPAHPTDTRTGTVPFSAVHEEYQDRLHFIRRMMPLLWDAFITKMEIRTFSLEEITREGKRLKNLYGSVEEHKKAFLEAVEDLFSL